MNNIQYTPVYEIPKLDFHDLPLTDDNQENPIHISIFLMDICFEKIDTSQFQIDPTIKKAITIYQSIQELGIHHQNALDKELQRALITEKDAENWEVPYIFFKKFQDAPHGIAVAQKVMAYLSQYKNLNVSHEEKIAREKSQLPCDILLKKSREGLLQVFLVNTKEEIPLHMNQSDSKLFAIKPKP